MRPGFKSPDDLTEESIAKVRHLPRLRVWRIFWKRADGTWHRYTPFPEASSLAEALGVIGEDANGCFFG